MLRHFGKSDEELTKELSEMLISNGYTFDYISDNQIKNLQVSEQMIRTNDTDYKILIIPKCEYIPLQTMQKILGMVEEGAAVVLQDGFPQNVPGLYNLKDRQDSYDELIKDISFVNQEKYEISKIKDGKILKGKDIKTVLAAANVYPESMVNSGLWFNRVKREEGSCYFISNWGYDDLDQWIDLNSSGKDAVWFNPMNKNYGRARTKKINNDQSKVHIQLDKGKSLILQFYSVEQNIEEYPIFEKTDDILALGGEWTLEFLKGGPTLPESYVTIELKSWTTHSDELKWFSGTVRYNTMFELTSIDAPAYLLDLGEVFSSAVVYLNGEKMETLVGPEFQLTVKADMLQQRNTLEIDVTNLMANRIIDLDKRGINYKKFYNINFAARKRENVGPDGLFTAKDWEPLESGLLGPVTITALKYNN
ncbi:MAG: glycosyl hydrolase [Calditrichaceae bacterium]